MNNISCIRFPIILWGMVVFAEYLLLPTYSEVPTDTYYTSISILMCLNLGITTVLIHKMDGTLGTFFYAFVTFYYVFHFGQVFMLGLFPWYDYNYVNYITTYMERSPEYLYQTINLSIHCINFFVLGGLMNSKGINIMRMPSVKYVNIGKKLFWILFVFRISVDTTQIILAYAFGYHATFGSTIGGGIVSSLANMWYGVVPLLILEIKDRSAQKRAILYVTVYIVISMLTGNRGHQMTCLIGMAIVYLTINNVNVKNVIKYGVFGILALYLLDFIYEMRNMGIENFLGDIDGTLAALTGTNIIFETVGTFGETIFTPFLTLQELSYQLNPFFGETFVKSLVAVVPDVTGDLKDINNEAIYQKNLGTDFTIGGSLAGEMIYNFKEFYPLFTVAIGYFYKRLSNNVNCSLRGGRYTELLISLPVCILLLWWVRDSIGNMTRQIIWLYIIVYFLKQQTKITDE